ncbi:hypothetical protein BGW80DRAFT_1309177 [Lactifluus volemus]|nr:hypothetical protein BGW80DRAFT_1309177 [Lactifluus volemus]
MSSNSTSGDANIPKNLLLLIGPIFIGNILSWFLFGVLTMQLYRYLLRYAEDQRIIKSTGTVYGLYLLDVAHSMISTIAAWSVLCSGWGKPSTLIYTNLNFALIPIVTGIISGWVQLFFAWRIWVLGKSSFWKVVTVVISAISLTQGASAITAGIRFAYIGNIQRIHTMNTLACLILGGCVMADTLIAISMFYLLTRAKKSTWSEAVNGTVTKMIRITIETGVLTAAAASLDLGLFLGFHNNNLHILVATMMPKLYSNALMASLNSRGFESHRSSSSLDYETYGTAQHFTTVQFGLSSIECPVTQHDTMSGSGTVVPNAKASLGYV